MNAEPEWSWPSGIDPEPAADTATSSSTDAHNHPSDDSSPQQPPPRPRQRQRRYGSRTCRICLEVVEPTFEMEESATGLFSAKERVRYISEDPELGRLISPCKCKGSQKYVHEGCLQAWRKAAPMSDRNFWKCPTCHFQYRTSRLSWGRWLSSKLVRVALTLLIFAVAIFFLGFVADPIINLWIDPLGSIADTLTDIVTDVDATQMYEYEDDPDTWSFHFLKGLFSLGLLGFLKSLLAMTPWQWFNLRGMVRGGRRGGTGRDRLENISWGLVLIGVLTFLAATWKVVSILCARTLEKLNHQIVDVQGDDPDEDEEGEKEEEEEEKKDI